MKKILKKPTVTTFEIKGEFNNDNILRSSWDEFYTGHFSGRKDIDIWIPSQVTSRMTSFPVFFSILFQQKIRRVIILSRHG